MGTYVLVHGAWQSASTWDLVVPRLRAARHEVYTPLLTGLGAHGHRLTKEVTLSWHVADVLALMNYEKLQDVILVGHGPAAAGEKAAGGGVDAGEVTRHIVDKGLEERGLAFVHGKFFCET